jgi:extracellular elastinolytic metalloproteinase
MDLRGRDTRSFMNFIHPRILWLFFLFAGPVVRSAGPDAETHARDWLRRRGDTRAERVRPVEELPAGRGARIVHFRDEWFGVPVFDSACRLLVRPDGSVLCLEDAARDSRPPRAPVAPRITPMVAVAMAATRLGLAEPGRASAPVRAAPRWYVSDAGDPRLAWEVQLATTDGRHWHVVLVDDSTGELLWTNDLARECQLRSFYPPVESPEDELPLLQDCPADPVASPFGWHDIDGNIGADSTKTRGVNVFAQEDMDGDNANGFQPDGGPGLVFDFLLDPALPPTRNRDAAITQAFALHNWMHDVMYHHGFGPADGNHQFFNYGQGGLDGDPVYVDVLDGAGSNNAIAVSPADGQPGRLNFYVFTRPHQVLVLNPGFASPALTATGATFGGGLSANSLAGVVVRALDANDPQGASTNDACSVILNAAQISGNIALMERGTCTFLVKVKQAQNAGAIAAIVVNNQSDALVPMTGEDASIIIPSVFIGRSDGQRIKDAMTAGALNVSLTGSPFRESGLDTTLALHEHAHLVTQRLTGGPANPNCLAQLQGRAMSEGWSDWYALVLTARASDLPVQPRTIGAYCGGNAATGIRRVPYSTDTNLTPRVYGDLRSVSVSRPHDAGEIWCATLWDLHWRMVMEHGFSPDFLGGDGGNQRVLRLVTEALKLQPCQPTFLDGRDALLQADQLLHDGENACAIWSVFAARGMGQSADDGGVSTSNLVTSGFDAPAICVAPRPEITSFGPMDPLVSLTWDAASGGVYRVQSRGGTSLPWTMVSGPVTSAGTSVSTLLSPGTNAVETLRVILESVPAP